MKNNAQELLDKYYQDYADFIAESKTRRENLEKELNEHRNALITTIVDELRVRVPRHMRAKAERTFSFSPGEVQKGQISLFEIIVDATFKVFGLMLLRLPEWKKEEIQQLNQAWTPIAGINPEYRNFWLGDSELSVQNREKSMNKLLDAQRSLSHSTK